MITDYMKKEGKIYATGERGKYGRLLVTALLLQNQLITDGFARPYDGGTRQGWCP